MKKKYTLFLAAVLMSFIGFAQTVSLPITEDFELEVNRTSCSATGVTLTSANFFNDTNDNDEWDVDNGGTGSSNTGPAVDHNPGTSVGKYLYTETSGCNNKTVNLNSTWMNWSTASTVQVAFWYHMQGTSQGTMHFDIRKGVNGVWQMDYITPFTDNVNLWQLKTIYVCDPTFIADSIQIRIRNMSGASFASDAAIDDISITALSPTVCLAPASPRTLNLTTTSIDLAWSQCNSSIKWDIEYGVAPLTPGTGTMVSTTTNPHTLTGLAINTAYEFRVRNHCTATDTTAYTAMTPFFFPSPPLAGVYTLNSAAATAGTNFQTFAALAQSLTQSGVSAPVTIDVATGSGPYTEQMILGNIPGASATNAVTINGNGETIQFAPASTDRRIVGFNGTSYVTLRNLTVKGTSTLYGYGIHFMGAANNITVDSCLVDLTAQTSTSSNNAAAILSSSSITGIFGAANNANDITISNTELDGGATGSYYGAYFRGSGIGSPANNITISNCNIHDFYAYQVYFANVATSLIDGNDIHRTNKTSVTTFYGVYNNGDCNGTVISNNRIHNTHDVASSKTGSTYGIFNSGSDASAATPVKIYNNVLDNFNSNGTIYAIWNSGSDNHQYYHNTISLDHTSATGGTTRGYFHSSIATGTDFRNNIITITRGGSGTKHGIYMQNPGTICDYNDVYVNAAAGSQSYGYSGSNKVTLADWQAIGSGTYGTNSFDNDPGLASATDLTPSGFAPDNSGALVGITTDITGATRGAIPDMGAIEFTGPSCPQPSAVDAGNNTGSTSDITWTESGSANKWQIEWGTAGFVAGTGTFVVDSATQNVTLTGLTAGLSYSVRVRAICSAIDTSLWTNMHTFFFAGSPLSGVYTMNSAVATGGTNFASFADLSSSLNGAGVNGPVTVNVVTGSGPYTERVIFGNISGGSATNTLTINGNGETVNFSNSSATRAVVTFDAASYVTLNNLTVKTLATTYGWGIHMWNASHHITIDSCMIDLTSSTSTSSSNVVGIVTTGSPTSIFTGGANASDVTISNSTIDGGPTGMAYATRFNGVSSSTASNNINLINNEIKNFYQYGVYFANIANSNVDGNDIHRTNKTGVSTFYGIYVNGNACSNDSIRNNKVHNTHDAASSKTGTNYPLYAAFSDASAPVVWYNNSVYAINGNGTTYGFYNNSSNNHKFYHNTISLDHVASTGGTIRGIYQTSTVTGVEYKNNIISVTNGGSGTKHGIYNNSSTSTIVMDYNNIYMGSAGAGAQHYGYYSGNQTTFANWQAANSGAFGTNSTNINPDFTSTSDVTPRGSGADGSADATVGITTDMTGATRGVMPDMGSIEYTFVVPACLVPTALNATNVGLSSADVSWTDNNAIPATSWELEWGTLGFTQGTGTVVSPTSTNPHTINGLQSATGYSFYVRSICGVGDTSFWSTAGSFITPAGVPFTENFDAFANGRANQNGWNNVRASDPDWTVDNAGTGSSATGPAIDHTLGNSVGKYVYMEVSSGSLGMRDTLSSPAILVGAAQNSLALDYWYHMAGTSMGQMQVWVDTNGVWDSITSYVGAQHAAISSPWLPGSHLITGYGGKTVTVHFIGERGTSFGGDMAIDDVSLSLPPSCIAPNALMASSISSDSASLGWTDNNTIAATSWEIEWGPLGFTPGSGTTVVTSNNPYSLNGLSTLTEYGWRVRSICGPADTSSWSSTSSFKTLFQCPVGAICATYTTGDITSDAGFTSLPGTSTCPGSVTLAIPSGDRVDSMSTVYDMTATVAGNAWISEQRSWLYSPTSTAGEATMTSGSAINASGTASYSRTGLAFANGAIGNVTVQMHAGRTFGGVACAAGINDIDNGSWIVIAYHSAIPACIAPTALTSTVISADSAGLAWTDGNTTAAPQYQISYGVGSFTAGSGTQAFVTTNSDTVSGLSPSTTYDWYVRAICAPTDTSAWSSVASFTTAFACPVGAICATYTAGDIPSDIGFQSLPGSSTCPDSLVIAIPSGNRVDSIGTFYDMTATVSGNAWISEQKTWLYSPTSMAGEATMTDGPAINASGTASYSRSGLTFANGGTGNVVIQMHAGRTFGGTACAAAINDIIDSSWTVIVYHSAIPSCLDPTALTGTAISTTSAEVSWTPSNLPVAGSFEISYGPIGFTAGAGTQVISNAAIDTITGLVASTTYDYYVRAICGVASMSPWSLVGTFATLNGVPYFQDFEGFANGSPNSEGWSNVATGNPQWLVDAGGTPSGGTGPLVDHTVGTATGKYVYLEASAPATVGQADTLYSADIIVGASQTLLELSYWYHFFGTNVGSMDVLIIDSAGVGTVVNTITGLQQAAQTDPWLKSKTVVSGYQGQTVSLVFIGIVGTGWSSDIAIDDVRLDLPPAAEIGITDIVRPSSGCGLGADSVEVVITNFGSANQTGFTVGYSLNGVAITPETVTGTVTAGNSMNYTFATTAALGTVNEYDIVTYTLLTGDVDATNDTLGTTVVSYATVSTFPYSTGFEIGNDSWFATGDDSWELGAPTGFVIDTAAAGTQAWVTDLALPYGDGLSAFLTSPCFDFTNVANPAINLDVWWDIESQWDGAMLQASTNGGATWSTIGKDNDPINWYNDTSRAVVDNGFGPLGDAWTGDGSVSGVSGSNGWVKASHLLDGLGGQSSVQLRFVLASDGNTNGDGLGVDNIEIYDKAPYYPAGILNTVDATGVADSLGVYAWTSGTVVGIDMRGGNGIQFTFIDNSTSAQEGLGVFSSSNTSGYVVTEGDSIMIRGTVAQFNGLTQLNPDSITVISSGNTLPTPMVVTDLDETTESRWLSIPTSWVSLSTSGAFSSNVDLTNGTDTITMRIDSDTDINDSLTASTPIIPGDTICGMFGIGGQFDSSVPRTSGYQIFPQRWSDVTICRFVSGVGIENSEATSANFELVPNPTNGLFEIRSTGFNNSTITVSIRDLSGRLISTEFINNANGNFTKSFDLDAESKGVYFITILDGESVINKKLIVQ